MLDVPLRGTSKVLWQPFWGMARKHRWMHTVMQDKTFGSYVEAEGIAAVKDVKA